MEFMVKVQQGNLIQAKNFSIGPNRIVAWESTTGYKSDRNWWEQNYATEERRDEVMAELEKWIREMVILKSITLSPINLFEKFDEIASKVIFTFPKE